MAGSEYIAIDRSVWNESQRWEDPQQWGYIVLNALEAMMELPPTDKTLGWVEGDEDTLSATLQLEANLRFFALPNGASDEVVDGLHGFVDRWHGALPFDEQERIALHGLYTKSRHNLTTGPTLAELLRTSELELMSSGIRKVVHGRDLLERWWEWRRGVGEFEGQDSHESAKEELGRITGRLLVDSDLDTVGGPDTRQLITEG